MMDFDVNWALQNGIVTLAKWIVISKWHYDGALDDCVEKAWEGIPFIG